MPIQTTRRSLFALHLVFSLLQAVKVNTVPADEGADHEADMYACYRIIKMTR